MLHNPNRPGRIHVKIYKGLEILLYLWANELADYGFTTVGVNLNSWIRDEGQLITHSKSSHQRASIHLCQFLKPQFPILRPCEEGLIRPPHTVHWITRRNPKLKESFITGRECLPFSPEADIIIIILDEKQACTCSVGSTVSGLSPTVFGKVVQNKGQPACLLTRHTEMWDPWRIVAQRCNETM